jgi:predicted nucleic acid-binding protein
VWRRLVDPVDRRRALTYRLTTLVRRHHRVLASREVAQELAEIPDGRLRKGALDRFRRVHPEMVTYRPRVREIAEELLRRGAWGPKDLEDMLHIGYAVVGRADALVTWDEADLAREKTRRLVAALGREWGFRSPDIATPPEVMEEWLGIRTPSSRK